MLISSEPVNTRKPGMPRVAISTRRNTSVAPLLSFRPAITPSSASRTTVVNSSLTLTVLGTS